MGTQNQGWHGFWDIGWANLEAVRERLDAGADPNAGWYWMPPLHEAAEQGTPEVVAELAARVDDVDVLVDGRSALWRAVYTGRPENARALQAAGADPVRPMMSGWSPARLSLATGSVIPSGEVLTEREQTAIADRDRMIAAIGDFPEYDGFSIACVGEIDAAEATRRLKAHVVPDDQVPDPGDWYGNAFGDQFEDDTELAMAVTDVPGGCVVVQPWHYNASSEDVMRRLSAGTVAYGMFANPKSGNQGNIYRDGEIVDGDLNPGGAPAEDDGTFEVLLAHLYRGEAVAYCCAYAGLRPKNNKAFTEPDQWILLPGLSYLSA